MVLLKFVSVLFSVTAAVAGINSDNVQLGNLIQRAYSESDSATVVFTRINTAFLSDFLKTNFDNPVIILSSIQIESSCYLYHNVILVIHAHQENEQYDTMLQNLVHQIPVRKFVIVSSRTFATLHRYFSYFVEKKFTRIFGIASNSSYAFMPFADNQIQHLSPEGPLPNALKDLNGFPFRTAFKPDIPRVFWYRSKSRERKVGGYAGQQILNFLKRHNATLVETPIKNMNKRFMKAVINATIDNDIEIGMNTYSVTEGLKLSYPIKFIRWTIIVPFNGHVDPNQYFLRPFSVTVWISIGLTFGYIVLMDIIQNMLSGSSETVWHCFSRTFLIVLGLPLGQPITKAYRMYSMVFLFSFVVWNFYVIYLTSFLTVYIDVKQYKAIKELIDNNVPVMMYDYEWDSISKPHQHPKGFEKIVVPVTNALKGNFKDNPNVAHAMGLDKAEFLVGLEGRIANHHLHTIIQDSLEEYYLGFLLPEHSIFGDILNDCIIQTLDAGLVNKWTNDAISQGISAGLLDPANNLHKNQVPLTLDHLRFGWTCLTMGWAFSLTSFAGEICHMVFLRVANRRLAV